jgi:hypothetical protein
VRKLVWVAAVVIGLAGVGIGIWANVSQRETCITYDLTSGITQQICGSEERIGTAMEIEGEPLGSVTKAQGWLPGACTGVGRRTVATTAGRLSRVTQFERGCYIAHGVMTK